MEIYKVGFVKEFKSTKCFVEEIGNYVSFLEKNNKQNRRFYNRERTE